MSSPLVHAWILTGLAVALLLVFHARRFRAGVIATKPIAAAGYVAAALAAGAATSAPGRALLVALALSWLGDVLLLARRGPGFLAGLGSFLLAHGAFAVAFAWRGVDPVPSAVAFLVLAIPGAAAIRWLRPHLRGPMRPAVPVYALALTSMLALAIGAWAAGAPALVALGAGVFYLSDLAVARERFVTSSFTNRLWGEPLYFGGQLFLATFLPA